MTVPLLLVGVVIFLLLGAWCERSADRQHEDNLRNYIDADGGEDGR